MRSRNQPKQKNNSDNIGGTLNQVQSSNSNMVININPNQGNRGIMAITSNNAPETF